MSYGLSVFYFVIDIIIGLALSYFIPIIYVKYVHSPSKAEYFSKTNYDATMRANTSLANKYIDLLNETVDYYKLSIKRLLTVIILSFTAMFATESLFKNIIRAASSMRLASILMVVFILLVICVCFSVMFSALMISNLVNNAKNIDRDIDDVRNFFMGLLSKNDVSEGEDKVCKDKIESIKEEIKKIKTCFSKDKIALGVIVSLICIVTIGINTSYIFMRL